MDVCSVYLLEHDRNHLILAATVGLAPESVGRIRMRLEEGLVGFVAESMRPVAEEDAQSHPRFKYFKESGEELFHSFLGVPLVDHGILQGVVVVQTSEPRTFSREEISMLVAAASQLSPVVSEARSREQFVSSAYQRLCQLANNLWWSWDHDVVSLFRELDPIRWREVDHNPVLLLRSMSIDQIEERCRQLVLHSRINYAYRRMREYLDNESTWGAGHAGVLWARPVAYFSAEFGLHESVPIYSGGLGILAGDHIKSASDLNIPLIGIGLYYDQGYFRQRLDSSGHQHEQYSDVNSGDLPLETVRDDQGQPIQIQIDTRNGPLFARVWKLAVGRNLLYLLDSDVAGNKPEDRDLTARLYGGDARVRIRQELLLGVGGVRLLQALGIHPGVSHLNEGHSAFAILELMRQSMQSEGTSVEEAMQRVACKTVFTTHTPVPAGHDRFSAELIEEHLGPLRDAMSMSLHQLLALGRVDPDCNEEPFCMTVLALKLSRRANAVSSLHGDVSRNMWQCLWKDRAQEEVPIGHITNGVHVLSWIAPQMHQVYDRHFGLSWPERHAEAGFWDAIRKVSDGELWETHQSLKARLLDFVRRRVVRQSERRNEPEELIKPLRSAFNLNVLTIGFARRFATYKRGDILFQDLDQLSELVNDPHMPVQFVFSGKAHPQDFPGKAILQKIAQMTRDERFLGKIAFVEDYDINVGRHLVQGVDVWLNNPRRPLEASGTSGMKVVLNGGLNLSILDGWWAEAFDGRNGFAIGNGESHATTEIHDERDRQSLLKTLREEVIPLYYDRDRDGIPRAWVSRMKRAILTLGWRFSSDRMVKDYVLKSYLPAAGGTSCEM
jgi:starch phosphorylase